MKSGDVFTIDDQAIDEVAKFTKVPVTQVRSKLTNGDTFSIAKNEQCGSEVVRASRWVDGKPTKGRPRRFPAATIARLLGETYVAPVAAAAPVAAPVVDDTADLEEHAADLLDAPEETPVVAEDSASSW